MAGPQNRFHELIRGVCLNTHTHKNKHIPQSFVLGCLKPSIPFLLSWCLPTGYRSSISINSRWQPNHYITAWFFKGQITPLLSSQGKVLPSFPSPRHLQLCRISPSASPVWNEPSQRCVRGEDAGKVNVHLNTNIQRNVLFLLPSFLQWLLGKGVLWYFYFSGPLFHSHKYRLSGRHLHLKTGMQWGEEI